MIVYCQSKWGKHGNDLEGTGICRQSNAEMNAHLTNEH
jgi:hypothetical protein